MCKYGDLNKSLKAQMKILTFARDMVGPKLIAALTVTVALTGVLENLSGLRVVLLHPLQVICQPLTT